MDEALLGWGGGVEGWAPRSLVWISNTVVLHFEEYVRHVPVGV